tara:strand:- start:309 stop:1442 length:1134 start_codon:yes stop_codon:yes gene_type:complete
MKFCRVCNASLAAPDYQTSAPAMTSLSTRIDVATEVYVCRACGHVQSPDLPDVQAFYDHDYRISLQSDDHDQLYAMEAEGPVFRTAHQARLLMNMDIPRQAKLLDFGAAKATTTQKLLDLRPDVQPHVFDVSEDYRGHWDSWISRDAQATYALPKEWEGRFDLITAHFVLEHVADPVAVLASLRACLAPGGQLFFTVPDPVGNPGDLLVVDHLNHFVPSSLHHALRLAGLAATSIRPDRFRGAYVIVAQLGANPEVSAEKLQLNTVLVLLNSWQKCLSGLRVELSKTSDDARIVIYGAGFYGALFAPLVGSRVTCFLDRNLHLQGGTMDGKPVLCPEDCPPVDLVIAALNPACARTILPPNTDWLPKGVRVIYPAEV